VINDQLGFLAKADFRAKCANLHAYSANFKAELRILPEMNFAEPSANGHNSAQKNCEKIFRAKLELKLDQKFANFLLPAWKSLLIYI